MNLKQIRNLWYLIGTIWFASCAYGVDDSERFTIDVTNTQLESPKLGNENFSVMANTDGSESVVVNWPLVSGAVGYLVNVNIVDDPSSPVVLIKDSLVDGCSILFQRLEDTKYEFSIKTIANQKLNNKDALESTTFPYSTMISAVTIPEGQDIAAFINANLTDSNVEQAFELEGGKQYTMNSLVDFRNNYITLRGSNKKNRPTVTVGSQGGLMTQNGLKIKFINFDCSSLTDESGFIGLGKTPDPSTSSESKGYTALGADKKAYIIDNPIIIQECNIKGLNNRPIIHNNKVGWCVKDFRIVDCIVQMNFDGAVSNNSFICMENVDWTKPTTTSIICNLMVKNSTIYNLSNDSKNRFIRFSTQVNPNQVFGTGSTSQFIFTNSTISKVMSAKEMGNNVKNSNLFYSDVKGCIFYDTWRLQKLFQGNWVKSWDKNTIFGILNTVDATDAKYCTTEDPQFVGPIDKVLDLSQVNGGINFKPQGANAVSWVAGDPRWYE